MFQEKLLLYLFYFIDLKRLGGIGSQLELEDNYINHTHKPNVGVEAALSAEWD